MTLQHLWPIADQIELAQQSQRRSPGEPVSAYRTFQIKYRDDPAGFVRDCIRFREDDGPSAYQIEVLQELPRRRRASVRGPHGLGKTAMAAWVVLWFALTRDGEDWKIPTTASAWRQLTKYLWPEIHKWARRLRWEVIGREPFNARLELQTLGLKLSTGEAFAVASDNHELIEGAHADHLLYLFDESKAIVGETFDAAEGAFSNATEANEAFALAISTPGEPQGRFYDIQSRKPGYEDWWVRAVTLAECVEAGRVSQSWAEQRARQWGEGSAVYQNRVLGLFAASDEDGVIPLAWIELANERWHRWKDAEKPGEFYGVGVDVADSGENKTVLALRYDLKPKISEDEPDPPCRRAVDELRYFSKEDTMSTAGRVQGILQAHGGQAVVDGIGVGAGVVSRLRELEANVVPFIASGGTDQRDRTGEMGFINQRSAGWWTLRELLDPVYGEEVALPPDDLLTGDLTAPHYRMMSGGKVQVEAKDEISKRLGRSPDSGDAVMQIMSGVRRWYIF